MPAPALVLAVISLILFGVAVVVAALPFIIEASKQDETTSVVDRVMQRPGYFLSFAAALIPLYGSYKGAVRAFYTTPAGARMAAVRRLAEE